MNFKQTKEELRRNILNSYGEFLRLTGMLDQALKIHKQAYQMGYQLVGESHADTAQSKHNIALVLMALGQLDDAEVLLYEAMQTRREVLG